LFGKAGQASCLANFGAFSASTAEKGNWQALPATTSQFDQSQHRGLLAIALLLSINYFILESA
jgi:hypothetical protein